MIIEPLLLPDIDLLTALQPPDWDDIRPYHSSYLEAGDCMPFKLVVDKQIAGVGTIVYHIESAWLAHIIVHPDFRNRGLGKIITQALIDRVDATQYKTISLIATDQGYPVYQKIGFVLDSVYAHLITNIPFQQITASPLIVPYEEKFSDEILALDKTISGELRHVKLREHLAGWMVFLNMDNVDGVYFPDLGNGLIIASDPLAGVELMKLRLQTNNFAILPANNTPAMELLSRHYFHQQRISRRMFLGKKIEWQSTGIFNRVSGQMG